MGLLGATAQVKTGSYQPANLQAKLRTKLQTLDSTHSDKKRILFVTSEFTDLVKVGGLGDVSAALPRGLTEQHDVRVLIPGYPQVINSGNRIRIIGTIDGHAALPPCKVGRMDLEDGVVLYVLVSPDLYEREGTPYGDGEGQDWADNHIRFARLGHAAAEIAAGSVGITWRPELVHCNDWATALAPTYMTLRGLRTPSIFTIHNLAYQGLCDIECHSELGLPMDTTHPVDKMGEESLEFYGQLSFMKAGINYASHITTVSKTYADEIMTEEFGCGLHGVLRSKGHRGLLTGITNGIDETWEPETDPHLVEGFDAGYRYGKQANASYVEQEFSLQPDSGPLFAVVSRLVQQKGIDLTVDVAEHIVSAGGRLVVIGQGERALENLVKDLVKRHPGRVGAHIGFNETDARRIFAASDFLLMPSRFEPCGLSQMYAQRLGSLPIARRTGGLADTVEDGVNGFLFRDANSSSYLGAIKRAFQVFERPVLLDAMRRNAMSTPLYWPEAVQPYSELYHRLAHTSDRLHLRQLAS